MEGVLPIHLAKEKEDVVDADSQDEEGDDLGDDKCDLDTEE